MALIFPYHIEGHKKQRMVWRSEARFIDLLCGRRGGKDWIAARKAIKNCYKDLKDGKGDKGWNMDYDLPRLLYWAVAPTYRIGKVQRKEILRFALKNNLLIKEERGAGRIWLRGGILWEFKSAEKPETLVAEGLNGLYVTETARLKRATWNDNLRPTLSDQRGWAIFATTPLGNNWYIQDIRKVAEDTNNKEWEAYYWPTSDNIKCPGLAEEVELARKTMPVKYFARNYLASIDAFQGQVYEEFTSKVHIVDKLPDRSKFKFIFGGIDWGYTHKGVILICGLTFDDNIYILEEVAQNRTTVTSRDDSQQTWVKIALRLQTKYSVELFFAGPDEPEHIEEMRREGVRIVAANNAVGAGIQCVSVLHHVDNNNQTRLKIHRDCTELIMNFQSYKWKEQKDGEESEQPEKVNDDAADALRYAVYTAYKRRWFEYNLNKAEERGDD